MHCWPGAPEGKHEHLRNPHRHEFHVTVDFQQFHDDRDIEFLAFKDWLGRFLEEWSFDLGHQSCEMMAACIYNEVQGCWGTTRDYRVEVSEDGENGALVE